MADSDSGGVSFDTDVESGLVLDSLGEFPEEVEARLDGPLESEEGDL